MSTKRDLVTHEREQQERTTRYDREGDVTDGLKAASRAIERGGREDYRWAVRFLAEQVVPALRGLTNRPLLAYGRELAGDERWVRTRLGEFLDSYEELQDYFQTGNASHLRSVQLQATGFVDDTAAARQIVEGAHLSLTAIAENAGVVQDEYETRVEADVLGQKIGEYLQDGEMDLGDPVEAISMQTDSLMTMFAGTRGFGKSNGLETEAETFYQQTFREGRDFKVIDLLGFRDGETWFPDIPQHQQSLRRVRHGMQLPRDFTESDDITAPEVEILHPLTPDLPEQELPYDTDSEEFTVKPFTVPASELRKPLMVSLIMSRLSEGEEQTIRQAYDDVDRMHDDWSLKDLADEIDSRDELSPKHKAKAVGVIRSLQNEGFIRTKSHPDTINWDEIFTSPERYTVFSQSFCNLIAKLICFAYLVDSVIEERKGRWGIPDCVLLMRELWKVTPHSNRRHYDERAASLQEAIVGMFTEVFRDGRHSGIHLLADTQQITDLDISVREMFNRYVIYSSPKETIKDVFEWTMNNKWKSFWATMTAKQGQAGIVGQVEPAVNKKNIEFLSPVEYAAPSHHHESDDDRTGWHARCKYLSPAEECGRCGSKGLEWPDDSRTVRCLDCGAMSSDLSMGRNEELRKPVDVDGVDWDGDVPATLQIDSGGRSQDSRPDPERAPVNAFVRRCVRPGDISSYVLKDDLYDAFNEFLRENGKDPWNFDERSRQIKFGNRFKGSFESEFDESVSNKKKTDGRAMVGCYLADVGKKLLDNSRIEVESAAAPIRTDD